MALADDINALPTTVGAGSTGHLNNHQVIHAALKDHETRLGAGDIVGTGSPEGKVAATIGTTYTDSAATDGAIRWIKTSGTGTTGWRVTYGDTGWRDLAGIATNLVPEYGAIVFRQLNETAQLMFDIQLDPNTAGDTIIPAAAFSTWAPSTPNSGARGTATEVNTSRTYRTLLSRVGSLTIYGAPRGTILNGQVTWTSDRVWTTRPGTPA